MFFFTPNQHRSFQHILGVTEIKKKEHTLLIAFLYFSTLPLLICDVLLGWLFVQIAMFAGGPRFMLKLVLELRFEALMAHNGALK